MLNIDEFVKEVGENAINHGWWKQERSFGELIALRHSELSEALEEYRKGKKPDETYFECQNENILNENGDIYCTGTFEECKICQYAKPEGIPSELADVIIRIFDMCNHYDIDIESILLKKHEFNKTRPYMHGGKTI